MPTEKGHFLEYQYIKCTFNNLSTTILTGRGCNILDFCNLNTNSHFLHTPVESEYDEFRQSPQRFGSAILFHPNRILEGKFTRNGRSYSLADHGIPISHGILKEVPYDVEQLYEDEQGIRLVCSFDSKNCPYGASLLWLFKVTFTFTLSAEGLKQELTFSNYGDSPIPFGLGYHTAFKIPSNPSYASPDYEASFSTTHCWEDFSYEYECDLTETSNSETIINDPLKEPIATPYTDYVNHTHHAKILNLVTKETLHYETDEEFKHWMVWNNAGRGGYLCIEPMTWKIDAPNSRFSDDITGYREIQPDETVHFTNYFRVEA